MFRNVRFYRLASVWPETEQALADALSRAAFEPCGKLTEQTSGWEAPAPEPARLLSRRVGGADFIQLRTQSRLLPAAAVNEALELRVAEFRDRMGHEPKGRVKRQLKEQTRDSLLPQALLRSERTMGCLLLRERVIAIDAGTTAKAERFLDTLRASLDGLDAIPLEFKRPVEGLLGRIFLGDAPSGIQLGRECRMEDPSDKRSSVRWLDMDLTDASIRRHVRDGMRLSHLGIEFGAAMSCVIDASATLSKLRFGGVEGDDFDADDPLTRFDTERVLLSGTLRNFVALLEKILGGFASAD